MVTISPIAFGDKNGSLPKLQPFPLADDGIDSVIAIDAPLRVVLRRHLMLKNTVVGSDASDNLRQGNVLEIH